MTEIPADKSQEKLVEAQAQADEIVNEARQQATGILDQAHARANEIVAEAMMSKLGQEPVLGADGAPVLDASGAPQPGGHLLAC